VCCSVLQCVAVCCSVLQCVAVCCSVLQCVAVCCSVHEVEQVRTLDTITQKGKQVMSHISHTKYHTDTVYMYIRTNIHIYIYTQC